jgi:hypothetical protein
MSVAHAGNIEGDKAAKLPMKDWILLPVIGLLTIISLAAFTEFATRWLFPVSQTNFNNCYFENDLSGDAPVKPSSVCTERIAESPFPVQYRYDSHGHRADGALELKRPGTYRIVQIGSSFAMGLFIPREMSFAAILPEELSLQTARNVELYNESTGGKFRGGPFPIKDSVRGFKSAFTADPDMILWIITPMDIENSEMESPALKPETPDIRRAGQVETPGGLWGSWARLENSIMPGTIWRRLRYRWGQSRTSVILEHYLIMSESPNQYVESYLQNGRDVDFLKTEPSARWQDLLENLEGQAEGFEKQAHDANIPFVAVLLPNRAQAAMISTNSWPRGYDPYKLDDELRTVIEAHGGTFVDVLPDFRSEPDPWKFYFPVDGHLNTKGHAMVSRMLAKKLTAGVVPFLTTAAHSQSVQGQGK